MADGDSSAQLSEDDIADALTKAFQEHDVAVDDDGVKVTTGEGLFHLAVRLSASATPLPQVPDDTSNLPAGSVEGAAYLILGTVQLVDDMTRVTMRIVVAETSEIKESSEGNANGSTADAVQSAAGDALAGLSMLQTT
jgi:hypothetical protein